MALNEEILARNMFMDGVRLTFPRRGFDDAQRIANHIYGALSEASGWDDTAVRKYVRYSLVKSGKRGGLELDSFFIGGQLAKLFKRAGLDCYVFNITEIHAKCYLIEQSEGSHEAFVIALWSGRGKFAISGYNPGPGTRSKRSSGDRGATIGNPKSDLHVAVKKYRGERAAVEGHVKGQMLNKVRAEARRRAGAADFAGNTSVALAEVFTQAAHRSAKRFLSAVRSRGLVLTDYFKGASYISWEEPLHEKAIDLLDNVEEEQYVAFASVPGFYYGEQTGLDYDDAE